jgi:hypothetical protein
LRFLLNFAHDDSFFYLKIANNFSRGFGSTFDRINYTNGYHPLWFFILTAIYFPFNYLFKASPEFIYRITFLIHSVICIFISFITFKIFSYRPSKEKLRIAFSIFIILIAALIFIRDVGMESILACLVLSAYYFYFVKEFYFNQNHHILKTLLLVLLFLCRTDYLFTLIPFIVISNYFLNNRQKRELIINLAALFIIAAIYYFQNYYFWGNIASIPQIIESSFPKIILLPNLENFITKPLFFYNQFVKVGFLLFVMIFCIFAFKKTKLFVIDKLDYMMFFSCCGFLLFTLSHYSFNINALREWYMTPPVFVSALLLLKILNNHIKFAGLIILVSLIFSSTIFYLTRIKNDKYSSAYSYALNLKSKVAENDAVFQIDFSGVVGFFSERNIIDGDGLANSFEYYDYRKNNKLAEYLNKYKVKYYSTFIEYNLKDSDTLFTDDRFKSFIKEYPFTFPINDLVIKEPYDYQHVVFKAKGDWLLFKLR